LTTASKTPLNGKVGPNRLFGTLETPLEQVKDIKNALGGSVNDVVLATVAAGVRNFLTGDREFDVAGLDFRAMAPVSVRSHDQRGTLGNQVAMWLVSLPVDEPDPVRQFAAVRKATARLKETNQALGASTLVRLSAGAPATLVSMASRLAAGVRPFNMTVTNVPGPQFPLYLLGSKMVESYPLVPLWQGHGVGVALFSYAGTVYWGFNADYDIVADVDDFTAAVDRAFGELHQAALTSGSSPPVKKGPKKRPPLGATTAAATEKPVPRKRPPLVASKATPAKKPVAKKPAAKKTVAKKTAVKSAAKKPAPKRTIKG
jgi:WS/DGAT/MGAT family acyltransferase